ncbi:MAG: protease HtpX [Arsenophonus sp.]
MMRIALFLFTNLAVMFVFGIILSLTGIHRESILGLIIMSGIFGFSGSFISLLISKQMALHSIGGKLITKPITEIECWLLNTVKNQADQVGIKMPEVAIYHAEDINAFATGANRNSSLIAISSGLLEDMDLHETEAVIAHEISHIANGDMVTMTLLQGVINTFVIFISRMIAQLTSGILSNNNNDNESNQDNSMTYFLVSMILEVIFGVLATIITMWFSRYREFRADAGSANLVGKEKMIAALHRLKTSYGPKEVGSSIAAFYINVRSERFSELFLSHPPIQKRIEALNTGIYLNR